MSMKSFLLKKMLKSKGVPDDQVEMAVAMMEKDPDLFKKIAVEIDAATKSGKNQQEAMMDVARKYQNDLKNLM
jgi:hypothetical protein